VQAELVGLRESGGKLKFGMRSVRFFAGMVCRAVGSIFKQFAAQRTRVALLNNQEAIVKFSAQVSSEDRRLLRDSHGCSISHHQADASSATYNVDLSKSWFSFLLGRTDIEIGSVEIASIPRAECGRLKYSMFAGSRMW
jgi:hypothetical protein